MLAREDDDWVETTARTPSQSRRAENPRDFPSQMDSEPDDAMTAYWQMNRYSEQSRKRDFDRQCVSWNELQTRGPPS